MSQINVPGYREPINLNQRNLPLTPDQRNSLTNLDDCYGNPPHTGEEAVKWEHGEIRDDFNPRPGGE